MTFMTFAPPYILWFAFVELTVEPGEPAPTLPFFTRGGPVALHFFPFITLYITIGHKIRKGPSWKPAKPLFLLAHRERFELPAF